MAWDYFNDDILYTGKFSLGNFGLINSLKAEMTVNSTHGILEPVNQFILVFSNPEFVQFNPIHLIPTNLFAVDLMK